MEEGKSLAFEGAMDPALYIYLPVASSRAKAKEGRATRASMEVGMEGGEEGTEEAGD